MRLARTSLLVALICVLIPLQAGCWDHREVDTLAIVAGVGIDIDAETGQYVFTAQIVVPSASKASSGTEVSGQGKGASIVSGTGDSVFAAARSIATTLGRRLYIAHDQIIVIGDNAARQGVRPILDLFLRDSEPRPNTWLLIAEGSARDIMGARLEVEKIPAMGIARLMKTVTTSSQTATASIHEFAERLASATTAPIATHIAAVDNGSHVRALGTSVFKDDKLVGDLDPRETRGLLWVTGKVGSGIITLPLPAQKGTASIEIKRSHAQVTAEKQNGRIALKVDVFMEGNLGAQSTTMDLSSPDEVELLGKQVSAALRDEITAAMAKAHTYHADIFGFGAAIERKYPKDWHQLKKDWDQQFASMEVVLNIQTNVRRLGLINRPVTAAD